MRAGRVLGGVGAVLTLVGVALVLRPDLAATGVLGPLSGLASAVGPRKLMLGGGGLVVLSIVVSALAPTPGGRVETDGATGNPFDEIEARPPEVAFDAGPRTGGEFDALVERAVAGDETAMDRIRDRLGSLVVATISDGGTTRRGKGTSQGQRGRSADAQRAVPAGTWTDDRVASAFLGGPAGPTQSLSARVRHWLAPERERERRIERTVRSVERLEPDRPLAGERARTRRADGGDGT